LYKEIRTRKGVCFSKSICVWDTRQTETGERTSETTTITADRGIWQHEYNGKNNVLLAIHVEHDHPSSARYSRRLWSQYRIQKITLQASPYFQNLLARWNDCSDRHEDSSYLIDADPNVFQHVLQFMRRPSKPSLFWTKETGFDYALYNRLGAEADYFLLHELSDWVQKKCYRDAVKTVIEVKVLSEYKLIYGHNQRICDTDIEIQSFYESYSGQKLFRNSCAIHKDNGNIRDCGFCEELMRAFGPHYDDAPKRLTLVSKRTKFDENICMNDMGSLWMMRQSKGARYHKKLACVKPMILKRGIRLRAPTAYHKVKFVPR
jgi:hypothetical protein